jgi:hypothetical protein
VDGAHWPLEGIGLSLVIVGMVIAWARFVIVRTRAGLAPKEAMLRASADVGSAVAVATVLVVTLAPREPWGREVMLVPFGEPGLVQYLENILLFVPIGLLGPLRWRWFDSWARLIVASAIFSSTIELLQYVLPIGRQTSVTDVLMNTLGATVGYLILRSIRPRLWRGSRRAMDG